MADAMNVSTVRSLPLSVKRLRLCALQTCDRRYEKGFPFLCADLRRGYILLGKRACV